MTRRRSARLIAAAVTVPLAVLSAGCGGAALDEGLPRLPPRPASREGRPTVVVIGIDGAEWKVIRKLQAEGELPNLTRLERGGASSPLKTAYGASPVIWTTVATGRTPEVHGITDFVVETPRGTVPVSSSVRRVPALWNMASRAGLRIAVLGWWASWPAEAIRGVMVTDRAHLTEDRIVYPESYLPAFRRQREAARGGHPGLGGGLKEADPWMEDGAFRDRIMAREARRMAGLDLDLLMVYFRGVDIASHRYWRFLEPEKYPPLPEGAPRHEGVIETVYRATDQVIGEILAALPPESDVFVLSDHGFLAGPEEPFVNLSSNRLLERLGFLVLGNGTVDFARSTAYPVDSPDHAPVKQFRLSLAGREPGGSVPVARRGEELDRLAAALEEMAYDNGKPLFRVRRAGLPPGIDLVAEVNLEEPTLKVTSRGRTWDDVVRYINRISGTHTDTTDGIFVARGPDLAPGADAAGIAVTDIAPTILYALGLPVADDSAGSARTELFTKAFRDRHPLRRVPTWGTMDGWEAEASPEDSRLLEELRSLGYLSGGP